MEMMVNKKEETVKKEGKKEGGDKNMVQFYRQNSLQLESQVKELRGRMIKVEQESKKKEQKLSTSEAKIRQNNQKVNDVNKRNSTMKEQLQNYK